MHLIIKKWSLLGLVLMTASAVIAAILPRVKDDEEVINGSLTQSTIGDDALSCKISFLITQPCHETDVSATTAGFRPTSIDEDPRTEMNTTFFENLIWG